MQSLPLSPRPVLGILAGCNKEALDGVANVGSMPNPSGVDGIFASSEFDSALLITDFLHEGQLARHAQYHLDTFGAEAVLLKPIYLF